MSTNLLFDLSPWWIFPGLIVGAAVAILIYYRTKVPWSKEMTTVLMVLRFLLVLLLFTLLVGPFVNQIDNRFEKPMVVMAIDDSQSMKLGVDSTVAAAQLAQIKGIQDPLENQGYQVTYRSLSGSEYPDAEFSSPQTDLNGLLADIESDFEGHNLSGVVLLSDGIYNRGSSPTFSFYTFPIYTIGAGDTIPKKDITLKNLLYNKITYQGNRFPMIAEIMNEGYVGDDFTVSISQGGEVLDSKNVSFNRNNQLQQVSFLLEASKMGLQRYQVSVSQKEDEFTQTNNFKQAYVDVIDGKENILIVASSPHPDVKSLVSALEKNENYDLSVFIPGIHDYPENDRELDLVVYHQVPDVKGASTPYLERLINLELPSLIFVGASTNLSALNNYIEPLSIQAFRNETDNVTPVVNQNFNLYNLSEDFPFVVSSYPPVTVPFGQFFMDAATEVMLNQRIGSIDSNRPLLVFRTSVDVKTGVFLGEGIWRWRLFEYSKEQSTRTFDELIQKTVQFLVTREDKRKFRVFPQQNDFFENEPVVFQAEAYNSIYERIFGVKVDLQLKDESGQIKDFTFVTSEGNSRFQISNLTSGVYDFTAKATVNNQQESAAGQFVVKAIELESLNLTADHRLLRELSRRTGGAFYYPDELDRIEALLLGNKPADIIYSSEKFLPVINIVWILVLFLGLVSSEWFLRKFHGSY